MAHQSSYWHLLTESSEFVISQALNLILEYAKYFCRPRDEKVVAKTSVYTAYEDFVDILVEGAQKPLNRSQMKHPPDPEWLDRDMLKKGQHFAKNYYFTICYSNLISLYLLFAHDKSLRALIFTGKSNEIETAHKRYVSTIHRVKCWYEHDLCDPDSSARKHIQTVNNYHLSISSKLNEMPEDEFWERSNLTGNLIEDNNSQARVRQTMKDNEIEVNRDYLQKMDEAIHVSQTHMAETQFGFMGLVVLYPEKFGIGNKEDIACFIHVWRYIGYLIGIEEKHNLCSGSHDEVVRKCRAILEVMMKPHMVDLSPYWEHMSICVCRGLNRIFEHLLFESTLAFLLDCIDLRHESFYRTMTFKSKFQLYLTKLFFYYLIPFNNIRAHLNVILDTKLNKVKYFS